MALQRISIFIVVAVLHSLLSFLDLDYLQHLSSKDTITFSEIVIDNRHLFDASKLVWSVSFPTSIISDNHSQLKANINHHETKPKASITMKT